MSMRVRGAIEGPTLWEGTEPGGKRGEAPGAWLLSVPLSHSSSLLTLEPSLSRICSNLDLSPGECGLPLAICGCGNHSEGGREGGARKTGIRHRVPGEKQDL